MIVSNWRGWRCATLSKSSQICDILIYEIVSIQIERIFFSKVEFRNRDFFFLIYPREQIFRIFFVELCANLDAVNIEESALQRWPQRKICKTRPLTKSSKCSSRRSIFWVAHSNGGRKACEDRRKSWDSSRSQEAVAAIRRTENKAKKENVMSIEANQREMSNIKPNDIALFTFSLLNAFPRQEKKKTILQRLQILWLNRSTLFLSRKEIFPSDVQSSLPLHHRDDWPHRSFTPANHLLV